MPPHVACATCAVVAGQLRFYPDVYGSDETIRRQIYGCQELFSRRYSCQGAAKPTYLHQLASIELIAI